MQNLGAEAVADILQRDAGCEGLASEAQKLASNLKDLEHCSNNGLPSPTSKIDVRKPKIIACMSLIAEARHARF